MPSTDTVLKSEGLLSYGITTSPNPIIASQATGNPSIQSIVITVSNNSMKSIYCNKLTFSFPIGDIASDLAATSKGILVSANSSSNWQISMTSDGTFTATPKTPTNNLITKEGLSFQLFNIQVNKQVGTFTFSVVENSSKDNSTFSDKKNEYDLAKFPYGFYVNDFSASSPLVQDGETVTLKWSGSDLGTYTILYGTASVDVTTKRIWTSPALTQTTTFSLKATVQEKGETVNIYFYITVIVNEPDIKCTTLTSIGEIKGVGMAPPNSVLMQSGDTANKFDSTGKGIHASSYEGWAICNGSNGTIDLRDKFIVGAGSKYSSGDHGGSDDVVLTEAQMPKHSHDIVDPGHKHDTTWGLRSTSTDEDDDSLAVYGRNSTDIKTSASSKTGISIKDAGSNHSFDNRPSYFALYYIMRIDS